MAAEKVIPEMTPAGTTRRMEWEKPGPDRYFWRVPVEVHAARVGELFLFVNPKVSSQNPGELKGRA